VAYEGTSVRTQTRVQQTVQFRNTALSANFAALAAETNGDLPFAIAGNATNISRIELFSTGGCVAAATNQAAAELAAPAATLGVGLHPFFAVVTDTGGHQYQTPTVWEQVPALQLSVIGPPLALIWPAIAGRQYRVLAAANLGGPFQAVGTVLATNAQAQWTITAPPAGAAPSGVFSIYEKHVCFSVLKRTGVRLRSHRATAADSRGCVTPPLSTCRRASSSTRAPLGS